MKRARRTADPRSRIPAHPGAQDKTQAPVVRQGLAPDAVDAC
jgi:hypothetical protein